MGVKDYENIFDWKNTSQKLTFINEYGDVIVSDIDGGNEITG